MRALTMRSRLSNLNWLGGEHGVALLRGPRHDLAATPTWQDSSEKFHFIWMRMLAARPNGRTRLEKRCEKLPQAAPDPRRAEEPVDD